MEERSSEQKETKETKTALVFLKLPLRFLRFLLFNFLRLCFLCSLVFIAFLPAVPCLLFPVFYNEAFHFSYGSRRFACRAPPNLRTSASSANRAGDQNRSNAKSTTTSSPLWRAAMSCFPASSATTAPSSRRSTWPCSPATTCSFSVKKAKAK